MLRLRSPTSARSSSVAPAIVCVVPQWVKCSGSARVTDVPDSVTGAVVGWGKLERAGTVKAEAH